MNDKDLTKAILNVFKKELGAIGDALPSELLNGIKKNITQVKHLPTGFMLIKKQVISDMCKAFPSTKYTDDVHFWTNLR